MAVWLELALGLIALALLVMASILAVKVPFFSLSLVLILLFLLFILVEDHVVSDQWQLRLLLSGGRIVLFSLLMVQFSGLYGGDGGAVVKAPTFSFYFVLIALHSVRGGGWGLARRQGLFSGGTAIGCWLIISIMVIHSEAGASLSYTYYLQATATTIVAELERLLALGAFTLAMALLKWPRPNAGPNSGSKGRPEARVLQVLIADDDAGQLAARKTLFGAGASVHLCEDGAETLAIADDLWAAGTPPDIALIDLDMPDIDGFEVALALRQKERDQGSRSAVIIAISGMSEAATIEKALNVGMDMMLVKPLARAEIWTAIYEIQKNRY
ncbi:MAG: response regulator [Parvularculaceae bacterium]